jgi:MFS family permease
MLMKSPSTGAHFSRQAWTSRSGCLDLSSCKWHTVYDRTKISLTGPSASTVMAYAIALFLPIILHQKMGFSVGISQVMTTPPYIFAGIFMYAQGWFGDKYHVRGPIIVFNALLGTCGLCLMAWTKPAGWQYLGVFLITATSNSSIPTVMAYQANNIRGTWKRASSSAILVTMGAAGGIVGALVFRAQDAPQYLPGIYASIA